MGSRDGSGSPSLLFVGAKQLCVCVHVAGKCLAVLGGDPCSPRPLLEVVGAFPVGECHDRCPPTPGLFDTGLHPAVVKCFWHQPVTWVAKDQGPP